MADELERDGRRICVRNVLFPGSTPPSSHGTFGDGRAELSQMWRIELFFWRRSCKRECAVELRTIAGICTWVLRVCQGNVGICTPRMLNRYFVCMYVNIELVRVWFGGVNQFRAINDMLNALPPGVPIDVKLLMVVIWPSS